VTGVDSVAGGWPQPAPRSAGSGHPSSARAVPEAGIGTRWQPGSTTQRTGGSSRPKSCGEQQCATMATAPFTRWGSRAETRRGAGSTFSKRAWQPESPGQAPRGERPTVGGRDKGPLAGRSGWQAPGREDRHPGELERQRAPEQQVEPRSH
jgi:hypothetical protein